MTRPSASQAQVEAFIRARGVTKCPTVALVPTQATVPETERAARERHEAELEEQRRSQFRRRRGTNGMGAAPKPDRAREKGRFAKRPEIPISAAQGTFFPGPKPTMAWLPKSALIVDHEYQRPLAKAHARRLAALFKWAHFQPLTVTPARPVDGDRKWAVIDGQHRLQAAMSIPDIDEVPCYVVPAAGLAEQAEAFLAVNNNHRTVTPFERFRAGLTAHDEESLKLQRILDRVGLTLVPAGGAVSPMTTSSVSTLRRGLRRCGAGNLEKGLRAIARAWPDRPAAFIEAYVAALPRLFRDLAPLPESVHAVLTTIEPDRFYREQLMRGRDERKTGAAMVLAALRARIEKS